MHCRPECSPSPRLEAVQGLFTPFFWLMFAPEMACFKVFWLTKWVKTGSKSSESPVRYPKRPSIIPAQHFL